MNSYEVHDPGSQPSVYCDSVYVEIAEFNTFNSMQIINNKTLQNMRNKMTHFAVALSAEDNGVYDDEFSMNFSNASGSLSIEYQMCTWMWL